MSGYKFVVPLAGTWIETPPCIKYYSVQYVVPLAGTWIETIGKFTSESDTPESFPSRERGLKHDDVREEDHDQAVVPLAGTWIETCGSDGA